MIRSYLSHLNLLLISRISAVIIVVIGIIGLFTLLSYKFGLSEGLTITFFPMIILAWTIERMSILWEEEGAKEVMVQGGGSLLVATLAYLAMSATCTALGVQLPGYSFGDPGAGAADGSVHGLSTAGAQALQATGRRIR